MLLLAMAAALAASDPEAALRRELRRAYGYVQLPPGTLEITRPLLIPSGAVDVEIAGAPQGSVLKAAASFQGEAVLICRSAMRVRLRDFTIDGNREALETPAGLPPHDVPFFRFTRNNGILADQMGPLAITRVRLRNIAGFSILVARSFDFAIEDVVIEASGSRNDRGRNNATGGILLEEGSANFRVARCKLRRVRGNGIWTHSLYTSPRNREGRIRQNQFEEIGRDAIQIGHANRIRVDENHGRRIGYPEAEVDVEGGGMPVAIDTAGNVDECTYAGNRFEEINGKCIDLDGFHNGEVRANTCINRGRAEDYPFGHYGIVMNNSNPDMQSEGIRILENLIDGAKFGGLFLIGSGHTVERNRFLNLNLAGCNESRERFGCAHFEGEPDLLQAGIYLGRRAERPAPATGNRIAGNQVSGHKMAERCILAAPGISLADNRIENNQCRDQETR